MTVAERLLFIRNHVVSVEDNGRRTLKIKADTASHANALVPVYRGLFDVFGDAELHFLGTNKYAYPMFTDGTERDKARTLTEKLLGDGTVTYMGTTISGTKENPTVTEKDPMDYEPEDQEASTSWATWLVVGAAAVIIFLLLWDKKKK